MQGALSEKSDEHIDRDFFGKLHGNCKSKNKPLFKLSVSSMSFWRRKWQPTPLFLPGESQGWGSLVGCRLWGCTELDTTEVT